MAETPTEAFVLRPWERAAIERRGLKPVQFEMSAEQVAAMDETMNHAPHCASGGAVEKSLHVGPASAGCTDQQQHSGGVSHG